MVQLTNIQLNKKIHFIDNYLNALNAADGSQFDANANVDNKNISTLETEIHKDINIQINRELLKRKLEKLYGEKISLEYIDLLNKHIIYTHDETSLKPYCVSVTMYPFLLDGVTKLGGESKAPKHLASFCGSFINFVFAVASQFAGAVATVEWLMYFDYFARKDFGDNYLKTHKEIIKESFQHVIYSLNQPAAARGYQCVKEDTTQLATPEGFKYLSELKEGDKCYVWKNGKISIQKINKLNIYNYDSDIDGMLLQFKGRDYQQTVTPNHRVVYKKPNTNIYNIKQAHELFGHSKLSLPIKANNDFKDFQISNDMIKLCVGALCDGSIDKQKNRTSRLSFYVSENRWGFKNLPKLLDKNGIGYTITKSTCNKFGNLYRIRIPAIDSQIILRYIKHTKKTLPHWVTLLSQKQAMLFIETWSRFNGNKIKHTNFNKNSTVIKITKNNVSESFNLQCDNENIADLLQQVCIIAGLGSRKYKRQFKKINSDENSKKETWYITTFKRSDKRISEYNKIKYKGKIWCPTTDAGVVIFREENGIPYISGNSVFWNISIYDKPYFEAMFKEFKFPDYSSPVYSSLNKLQKYFMKWFNKERTKSILTYPVITAACLSDGKTMVDKKFKNFIAKELSEGNSFFIFMSENAHALSSCCRLKNDVSDQMNDFSYSLGAGGVSTGSINVITMNLNRIIQDAYNNSNQTTRKEKINDIITSIRSYTQKIQKYQIAFRKIIEEYKESNMLPIYNAHFIELEKQFLTIGINGLVEGAEFLNMRINNNEQYKNFASRILKCISDENKIANKKTGYKFNTEFVPAENLGVKNAKWDRKDGYKVLRNCYNSYMYLVEDENISILDKFELHGKKFMQYLDGGSAYHCNLENYPTKKGFEKLLDVAAIEGCEYFCFNIKITICNNCGNIDKRTLNKCPKCGSSNIDYATRIIGYLKRIKSFSKDRQNEESIRYYKKNNKIN